MTDAPPPLRIYIKPGDEVRCPKCEEPSTEREQLADGFYEHVCKKCEYAFFAQEETDVD